MCPRAGHDMRLGDIHRVGAGAGVPTLEFGAVQWAVGSGGGVAASA